MGPIFWITGTIIGVVIGLGLALRIVASCIMRSNDIGDSTGTTKDFEHVFNIFDKKDRMSERKLDKKLGTGRDILNCRREAVGLPKR